MQYIKFSCFKKCLCTFRKQNTYYLRNSRETFISNKIILSKEYIQKWFQFKKSLAYSITNFPGPGV